MSKQRSILWAILSVFVGAVFLYSAYTKVYTLQSFQGFEFSIIEYLSFPWWLATLSSRLLIGIELALGVLIAFHFYGNLKWVLKLAVGLLVLFTVYLIYLWVAVGDDINCGCFGDAIWMSPSSSIVKNILLILGIWLLIKFQAGIHFRWAHLSALILLMGISAVPFFLYPIPPAEPQWLQKDKFEIDLSALYQEGKADQPQVNLKKGKHVIAFFSLACPHCKMAAYKMQLMKQKNPSLPFFFVLAGRDENLPAFWEETKAESMPHTRLTSEEFTAIAGFSWPVIYWVNNGIVEAETNYIQLNQAAIEEWLETEQ